MLNNIIYGRRGKLSTLLFVGLMLLPLIGLLIMDYQLKVANDITGAYIGVEQQNSSEGILASAVIIGVIAFFLVALVVSKMRKSRLISTMPLAKINKEIKNIEERLKGH